MNSTTSASINSPLTNFAASTAKRLRHLDHLNRNPSLRPLEMEMCRRDVIHWINHWVWTDDPREDGAALPFDTFQRQNELLAWLAEREREKEPGLVEKSRDVGATWIACCHVLHAWLYRGGFAAGFGSRKREYVDKKGDRKTIFEKLRFALYRLPKWMLPKDFNRRLHDSECKLINSENGATITGEGGDEIGRGDRTTMYFVDESASLEHPKLADAALAGTTNVRIDISTPKGTGNPFWQKRFSGLFPVFTFHWKDDPRKTREEVTKDGKTVNPWYVAACRRLNNDPVLIAQELEIDYTASLEGVCIPAAWVRVAIDLPLPGVRGRRVAGFDVADEGRNRNVFTPRCGPNILMPVDWHRGNTTQSAWRARDEAVALHLEEVAYDSIGVGAGIRGAWESAEQALGFYPRAVNVGKAPSDSWWPDGQTSKEKFLNLRAELWWKVRCRFEKVFEYVTQGISHPFDEMISIPNHPQLIAELSMVLFQRMETGKIRIEPKDAMRDRGVQSPDFADSLVMSEACPTFSHGVGTTEAAERADHQQYQVKDQDEDDPHQRPPGMDDPQRWKQAAEAEDAEDGYRSNSSRHGYYGRRR